MSQTNHRHSLHEIMVKGEQGAWISLWHLPSKDSKFSPVVLTHGTFSILNLLGSAKKEFRVFGKKAGFAEEYTHARLIACKNAQNDIWPVILNWLVRMD